MRIKVTPGLLLGLIAVVVALAGTAFAASGTLVHIGDPTASYRAKVDSTGALKAAVSGSVNAVVPKTQFRSFGSAYQHGPWNLTQVTSASLAIDRIAVALGGVGSLRFPAKVDIWLRKATNGACDGSVTKLVEYQLEPNHTVIDAPAVPILVKPPAGSTQYCIAISSEVHGDSGSYYAPHVSIHGHVVSGSYSGATTSSAASDQSDAGDGKVVNGQVP